MFKGAPREKKENPEECPHCFIEGNCGANARSIGEEEDGAKRENATGGRHEKDGRTRWTRGNRS